MQRRQPGIQSLCLCDIAVLPGGVHVGHQFGRNISGHRYAADAALGESTELRNIFTRQLAKIVAAGELLLRRAANIGRRVLYADDII